MQQTELNDELYEKITDLCDQGEEAFEQEEYTKAMNCFEKALELVPRPLENWEASTWILASLGDCLFMTKQYEHALVLFERTLLCPGGLENPFPYLRIGESHFELGNKEQAKDALARAYMLGDKEIFATEDPKYFAFIKQFLKGVK